jgi:hypothetical protein
MDESPTTLATVVQIDKGRVEVALDSSDTLVPRSRARVVIYETTVPLPIEWDGPYPTTGPDQLGVELVRASSSGESGAAFKVTVEDDAYSIANVSGTLLVTQSVSVADSPADRALQALHAAIGYERFVKLATPQQGSQFAESIMLRVESLSGSTEPRIVAGEVTKLAISNRSTHSYYFSIWWANSRFGVQRLFPSQSDCALLAGGREVWIPFTAKLSDPSSVDEEAVVKVFVTAEPHVLDVLQQNGISHDAQIIP